MHGGLAILTGLRKTPSKDHMRTYALIVALSVLLLGGCAPVNEGGIRFQADSPPVDEAFQKISAALKADHYAIEYSNPSTLELETDWRTLRDTEYAREDLSYPVGTVESKLIVQLRRGEKGYGVVFTPMLKYTGVSPVKKVVADDFHPLTKKWNALLRTLVR
jgi:uncharacterized lipoprotein